MIRNTPRRGRLPRTEELVPRRRMTGSPRPQTRRTFAVLAASVVLAVASGLVLAAGTAAPASAAAPCWHTLINDWFDGKIDNTYPRHCYTQAIDHLPRDVHTYSNAADEIRTAMLAMLQHKGNGTPPSGPTSQPSGSGGESTPTASASGTPTAPKAEEPKRGLILKAIEWLGPSDAGAVPLPLLILAGVAFLLLAAAGGSLLNRRLQERRLPPPPQP
jgi:hypothetical protein